MQMLEARLDDDKLKFFKKTKSYHCNVLVHIPDEETKTNSSLPKIDIDKLMKNKSSIEKWEGCLKDVNIENWKDDRINYLMEKHK